MPDRDTVLLSRFCEETGAQAFEDLPSRISFQKRIYLLQAAGVDLGYRFTWDLHGPYSKGLAIVGDQLAREQEESHELGQTLTLREPVLEKIRRARDVMAPPEGVEATDWLEFLASLHFLRTNNDLEDSDAAFQRLVELKPHLASLSEVRTDAWERLDRFGAASSS